MVSKSFVLKIYIIVLLNFFSTMCSSFNKKSICFNFSYLNSISILNPLINSTILALFKDSHTLFVYALTSPPAPNFIPPNYLTTTAKT